jgi:hypothetical protein
MPEDDRAGDVGCRDMACVTVESGIPSSIRLRTSARLM